MRENELNAFVNFDRDSLSILEYYINDCTCEICGTIDVDIERIFSYEKFTCESCTKKIQRDSKIDNLINDK